MSILVMASYLGVSHVGGEHDRLPRRDGRQVRQLTEQGVEALQPQTHKETKGERGTGQRGPRSIFRANTHMGALPHHPLDPPYHCTFPVLKACLHLLVSRNRFECSPPYLGLVDLDDLIGQLPEEHRHPHRPEELRHDVEQRVVPVARQQQQVLQTAQLEVQLWITGGERG